MGAGPAGLAAARAAAEAGARVRLIDSAPSAGGQFFRGRPDVPPVHPKVEHLADSAVWHLESVHNGHTVRVRTGPADAPVRRGVTLHADALILATGAYDRALPFPGWDLPGVVTAGGAQAMAKGHGVAVGRRVIIAGTGPFLLPVATSLAGTGATVVEVLEANGPAGWLRAPRALLAGAGRLGELAGYAKALAAQRIPYRTRRTVIAAHGTGRVEAVTTAALDNGWRIRPGTERRIAVDAVCVGYGFTPQLELAVAAGCRLRDGFVEVDAAQATSTPGVFAAGELTGIGGAKLAAAEGTVAGTAAAASVEVPRAALRAVRQGRIFADGLAAAHPIQDGWRTWLTDDTLVCRCEEVTLAGLCDALDRHRALGVRTLKLTSRVGLGPCQGRVCGRNAAELAAGHTGGHYDPADTARRPIAAPVRLGELAEEETVEEMNGQA
ncbi:FAD-dependent oxidoreductase [Herbihabitans rhizosphaerae]|uniref:FAD-dependent oxidoreductase n=1 Tax=Herbihabitans rhizosphaerae TaxID=1872711 RepID=UPI001F5EB714|nr:FAD-dependent oxidoreductase [Herbihabitans rhizosphaerae]